MKLKEGCSELTVLERLPIHVVLFARDLLSIEPVILLLSDLLIGWPHY